MHAATLDDAGWLRVSSGIEPERLATLPVDAMLETDDAGSRKILDAPWCAALVAPIRTRLQRLGLISGDSVAVQCTLFRKTPTCNWNVPYHQDLSIPVASRVDHPALSGWSVKEDGHYVQPDDASLARMLGVRLHLDACGSETGALRVLPGSHRLGRIGVERIAEMDKKTNEIVCAADAGDLLLMRPLLLHASSKAVRANGRRVLHYLFAPAQPGYGLSWRIAI